jgi:hypothetical protein
MSGTKSKVKCAACGKRIRDHEPDLVLRNLDDESARPRYFHTRCGAAAYAVAIDADPALWRMTVRHVEEMAN